MSDLIRVEHENGLVTYESLLLRTAGVPHAFTTRLGGVSPAPYDSLNLAAMVNDPDADNSKNVAANFRKIRQVIGCRRHIRAQVNQVHGCAVWHPPTEPVKPVDAPRADAIATDKPGLLLMVRVADCVPVLLASKDGRVASAVHAGWRGIIAGIVTEAVRELISLGKLRTQDIVAAIGPCISVNHFEVGGEVVDAFDNARLSDAINRDGFAKPHIDLPKAVATQLKTAGLNEEQIDRTDRCTYTLADEFFSHRRDNGRTGRQAALIAVRSGPGV